MKKLFLSLCIGAVSSLYAIDNNVELIANGGFSEAALVSQASIAATDDKGVWIAGDNTKAAFTPSISGAGAGAYFTSTATTDAAALYDNFLGQITSEALTTGRYHISLKAMGDQPFYLKISGVDALGNEYVSILKNAVGDVDRTGAGGYSIKFTPASASAFGTIEADLDITIPSSTSARMYFVFPKAGTVALDDISLKRTGDIIVYTSFYVRPTGNTTAWTNTTGVNPDQIITGDVITISGSNTYYLAAGNYTTGGMTVTSGKIYGGFKGDETSINLSGRAISDLDGNGIIEPWEFTNESNIKSSLANSSFTGSGTNSSRLLVVSGNGGEVNGVTLSDFSYTSYGGPIYLGKPASTPVAADTVSTLAGTLRFCTVRNIKSAVDGAITISNPYSLIDQCLIENTVNVAGNSGGAIHMKLFGGLVEGCVIRNNVSSHATAGRGGAICISTGSTTGNAGTVRNCLIYNNASTQGGAIRIDGQAGKRGVQIINCTIANNKSGIGGGSSPATVELINCGLISNSIIVNPALTETGTEIRANTANSYIANTIYGDSTYTAGGAKFNTMRPRVTSDFGFSAPTTFSGVVIEGYTTIWDATAIANYNAIRSANFKLTDNSSPAVILIGAKSLPANYTYSGGAKPISITATIPAVDLMGVERPIANDGHLDLGAYQFSSLSTALTETVATAAFVYAFNNEILINAAKGQIANVYSVAGQLVKSVTLTADNAIVPMYKGIYIVKVANSIQKVIVK